MTNPIIGVMKVNWHRAPAGGGGLVLALSIADNGTLVCTTDAPGTSLWDTTQNKWVNLITWDRGFDNLPVEQPGYRRMNGSSGIAIAPSNSDIIALFYNGYIYRSINKGVTFQKTNYPQNTDASITPSSTYKVVGGKLAIDPINPNVMYVTNPGGVAQVTFDGGITWGSVPNLPSTGAGILGAHGFVFDRSSGQTNGNTNTIYVGVETSGLWQSTNAGLAWTRISTTVGVAPLNGRGNSSVSADGVLYFADTSAGGTTYRINRWKNLTWSVIQTGTTSVAAHPVTAGVVVTLNGNEYYYSSDYGTTWSNYHRASWSLTSDDQTWWRSRWLGGMPVNHNHAIFDPSSPNDLYCTMGQSIFKATIGNYAPSWSTKVRGIEELIISDVMHESNTDVFVAVWDEFAFKRSKATIDSVPASVLSDNQTLNNGWQIAIDPQNNQRIVIACTSGSGQVYNLAGYSTDGGVTWNKFVTRPSWSGVNSYGSIAINNGVIIWTPNYGAGSQAYPARTDNYGVTWTYLNNIPGIPASGNTGWSAPFFIAHRNVCADSVNGNVFYMMNSVGGAPGLYRSIDGGISFSFRSNPFLNQSGLDTRAVPGFEGHVISSVGHLDSPALPAPNTQFCRTRDGGATWVELAPREVLRFGFGARFPGEDYPALYIAGWLNGKYGIYFSTDEGDTWTQLWSDAGGIWPIDNGTITAIDGDKDIIGRVYIGMSGTGIAYSEPVDPIKSKCKKAHEIIYNIKLEVGC